MQTREEKRPQQQWPMVQSPPVARILHQPDSLSARPVRARLPAAGQSGRSRRARR
jgi:hypothetical protein